MIPLSDPARARWTVALRVLAGTLGAYALTSLTTTALSLALAASGMDRVEAAYAASLASFALFAMIAMAVFHAHSVARAWAWLASASFVFALLSWALAGSAP